MKVNWVIYLVRDSHGHEDYNVVNEGCCDIQVCGMKTKKGREVYFESEGYNLADWCEENDFEYRKIEREKNWEI